MKKYDFHAHYAFAEQHGITQAEAIDFLTGVQAEPPRQWPGLAAVTDDGARLQLLAQALASAYKERARMGQQKGKAGGLGHWIMSGKAHTYFAAQKETYLNPLKLVPAAPDLARLPEYSFAFHVIFTLAGAYLSRDDRVFYILDNPVKKEWVFKLPYIAPSQWKGALRAAMVQQLTEWWQSLKQEQQQERVNRKRFVAQRVQLTRLFGTEIEHDQRYLSQSGSDRLARWYQRYVRRFISVTGFVAGHLHFYPTFFDHIGLEVINPHNRKTGAGKQPIYLESVPIDVAGTFTLLYVPFDRIGEDEPETRTQVAADLELVATGIQAMMTTYGFGARTSSGFGVAKDELNDGCLRLIGLEVPDTTAPDDVSQPAPGLPRYLSSPGQLHPDFRAADGSFRYRSDAERQAMKKSDRQLYDKARSWWEREGKALAVQAEQQPEPSPVEELHRPAIVEHTFANWEDLRDQATALARLLRGGEG
jgi:CRISPR-associated protein Cmr2